MAGRTLRRIMLFWRPVAGPAVSIVGVVKVNLFPVGSRVAVGAHTCIVGGGTKVASTAVDQATVGLDSLCPGVGVVAKRALAAIVLKARDVAGFAVVDSAVLVDDLGPVVRGVAEGAGAVKVFVWEFPGMAVGAGGKALVAERDGLPVIGGVARRALTRIVVGFRGVAGLAVGIAGVVKAYLFPVVDDVTVGALTHVVLFQLGFARVARFAVVESGVVKGDVVPVLGVGVAVGAGSGCLLHGEEAGRLAVRPLGLPRRVPQEAVGPHVVAARAVFDVAGAAFVDVGAVSYTHLRAHETRR